MHVCEVGERLGIIFGAQKRYECNFVPTFYVNFSDIWKSVMFLSPSDIQKRTAFEAVLYL